MTKGVRTRAIIILAVLLLAVYGIIGLPRNKEELVRPTSRTTSTSAWT